MNLEPNVALWVDCSLNEKLENIEKRLFMVVSSFIGIFLVVET